MELLRLEVQSRQQRLMSLLANPLASGAVGNGAQSAVSSQVLDDGSATEMSIAACLWASNYV